MAWGFYNAAGFLKTNTGRELVSTLPSSPVDGQEVFYQAAGTMSTDGIVWHLRYRAGSSSANKWEYVGGREIHAQVLPATANSGSSATYAAMPTTPISLTLPATGEYQVTWGAGAAWSSSAGASAFLGYRINGVNPTDNFMILFETPAGETAAIAKAGMLVQRATGVTAGQSIELVYKSGNAAWTWNFRSYFLSFVPIRLA